MSAKPWPAAHVDFLRDNYSDDLTRQALADLVSERFGVRYSIHAIKAKAKDIGLKRKFDFQIATRVRKWTDADTAALEDMRWNGCTFPAIADAFQGKFTRQACSEKARLMRYKVKPGIAIARVAPSNFFAVRGPVIPVARNMPMDEVPAKEPAPLVDGPDGIMAASFAYVRRWCLWAGLVTDGTDIDTRVNRVRRLYNRAPFVVVAA